MTDPARRALLGAIITAPVVAGTSARASVAAPDLSALDREGLLDAGSGCADPDFARLCAAALVATARGVSADALHRDARASADAAMPAFPEALTLQCRLRGFDDEIKNEWTASWRPDQTDRTAPRLGDYARRYARKRGVPYGPSVDAELRTMFDGWNAQREAIEAQYLTRELAQASDAAWDEAGELNKRVMDYAARTPEVFMLKLSMWLREAIDSDDEDELRRLRVIAADASRTLAA